MEKQYENKITWTIKNFSSLTDEKIYSDHFVVGASKWRLLAYPKGCGAGFNSYFSLFLDVSDSMSLPSGWKRHAKFCLTVVNQISEKLSANQELQRWFSHEAPSIGDQEMLTLRKLLEINGGFLVNEEVKIVAQVSVLEVIGESDVLEETLLVTKSIDVNGFQVLPSQVKSVNSLFVNHPDFASELCLKNPHLRTAYLNSVLSLTEILNQSPKELSIDDLIHAYFTLNCVKKSGFKLDWLERKLKEVGKIGVKEMEEELKNLKQKCSQMEQKCSDIEALLDFLQKKC